MDEGRRGAGKYCEGRTSGCTQRIQYGLSQRWTFIQLTVQGISELFLPLEDMIRNTLIPLMICREVSELERMMIALPYRYGVLGIRLMESTVPQSKSLLS